MIEIPRRNWKYAAMLAIGFFAAIGISTATPQAYGHITNNLSHVVGDIFNIVTGIDNRLPSDPADQSDVEDTISGAVTDIGPSKGVKTEVTVDPADGTASITTIIGEESGKTFSGRISGIVVGDPANNFSVSCGTAAGSTFALFFSPSALTHVNEEFACTSLEVSVGDFFDATDDGPVLLDIVTQYVTAETD